ncbi:MAG: glycoside hydrolase TIM-barrel-like domain-containing protein, partial [Hyphomicrobium sp.]
MATLALAAAGAAVGSSLLPAGIGILGATISGATLGGQIGALAGSFVDNALFGSSGSSRAAEGPRLSDLHITSSTEGANIPRLYGRARLGGQVIWATDLVEEIITSTQSSGGGKGIGGSSGGTSATEYRYYGNFAVALCEGPVTRIGRVWADGRELDLSTLTFRFYRGSETQAPDSLIAAHEGAGRAPAYRGTAYIVFEKLALADFGNRVPQLSFEVYRNIEAGDEDIKGVVVIPGSGEFVYATEPVRKTIAEGVADGINVHTRQAPTDWDAGIDQLAATLPNAKSISLVVSWFGTDLRAGNCEIKPGVENATTETEPLTWSVAGVARAAAYVVSEKDGRPAYGGTPSDQTVVAAIRDLNARGMSVTLTPFVLMDIASGNTLPDPYGGAAQAVYPWRGRITCHPAAGEAGSPDTTAAAAAQIAAFVGTAQTSHFALSGDTVVYSGPAEWSYRRMVLHQAFLAKAAGGVDAFLIGTELRGLTQVRSSANVFPFVNALVTLAADVKSVLGAGVKVTYAADWSEYFGYQPADGSHDVYFHLDPLWASSSIDAVGIDVYWPLADWRDGRGHLDYVAGYRSVYDLDYLKANVQGGEGFDWYYASQANRDAQIRSPINDSYGKPWVFRYKDLTSWWQNAHYNRPGGVESTTATAWVAQSKPVWFMEIGCPAVDKGANQPNVFVDPKSSESAYPYSSNGVRDDLMQRRFLKAFIHAFDWTKTGYVAGLNPVSAMTGQRMVDLDHIHVYCWDARPYPAFPQQTDIWGDGANWQFGHWLNGRLASAPLGELVAKMLADYGFAAHDTAALYGTVPGYVIDRIMSPRDALQPLELAYFFDSIESAAKIRFRHRGLQDPVKSLTPDALVETRPG